MLNHVLEHLGKDPDVFINIIKEIYRICKNGALVKINVPHPRHNNFINDPTHVRIVTPELMGLFSKNNCLYWQSVSAANSPLALYHNVDFQMVSATVTLEEKYYTQMQTGEISNSEMQDMLMHHNNIATEYRMVLSVIK
jgi:hypothetical protein